jgi:hypothetical protein
MSTTIVTSRSACERQTMMTSARTPVIVIHGLWLHASSWGALA